MRALVLAAAVLLSACGGTNPKVEEPLIRATVRDLGRALFADDADKCAAIVLLRAGQGNNPVGAAQADTPEGRDAINKGNRRNLRGFLADAGIISPAELKAKGLPNEAALDRLDQALRVQVNGVNALVTFEIAGVPGKKFPELVSFKFQKSEGRWLMYDYEKELVTR
jgi:hypothetical protein